MKTSLVGGEYAALRKRKLSEETCRHLDYKVNQDLGVQVATYYDADGAPVAQKLRGADKRFKWVGEPSKALLYGQQRCSGKGKRVIVTEGEIDALSVSQALGNKWPVVSIPNGAGGARKDVQKQLEWLDGFEEIVLFFDQDEPGQKAAVEVAEMFAPGKVKIVTGFPFKDANEALVAGKVELLTKAQWQAKPHWPVDLCAGNDEEGWDEILADDPEAPLHYPWTALDKMLYGMRFGEIVLWASGTGQGKSQSLREVVYHLLPTLKGRGEKVGLICLEESAKRTRLGLMSIHLSLPLHLNRDSVPEVALRRAYDETLSDVILWRHWGSVSSDRLFSKVRAMAAAGCRVIVLDHVSIVVSGSEEVGNGNERIVIDKLMTKLRSMVEELQISMHIVSHLRKPGGTPHERGGEVTLDDLRGSGSLKTIPDGIIGLERDQQAEEPRARRITKVRVIKNRHAGETGLAGYIEWNPDTFRYSELDEDPFATHEEEPKTCETADDAGF